MNTRAIILSTVCAISLSASLLWHPVNSMIRGRSAMESENPAKKNNTIDNLPADVGDLSIIKKWELPAELTEISGITWLSENHFACVQDEEGSILLYNTASDRIEKKIPFAAPGDYEGITVVNKNMYVMRSDGVIFQINNFNAAKPVVTQYKTHLTGKNDVEALTYDAANNRLLVSFKGEDQSNPGFKGIYSFDLRKMTMEKTPVYKIISSGTASLESKKKRQGIQASDLCVHPVSKDIYLIDATGPTLMVFSNTGQEKISYPLHRNNFTQPEGITFSPDGTLFISNEGKKGHGNILEVRLP